MGCGTVQCSSAVRYTVQCGAVRCGAVQCGTVLCGTRCGAMWVRCGWVHGAVRYDAVWYGAAHGLVGWYDFVRCGAVQRAMGGGREC